MPKTTTFSLFAINCATFLCTYTKFLHFSTKQTLKTPEYLLFRKITPTKLRIL